VAVILVHVLSQLELIGECLIATTSMKTFEDAWHVCLVFDQVLLEAVWAFHPAATLAALEEMQRVHNFFMILQSAVGVA